MRLAILTLPAALVLVACGGSHKGTRIKCRDDSALCDVKDTVGEKRDLARGLNITGVEINQAVAVDLMRDGEVLPHSAPLVANRGALIRVYVEPDEKKWDEREVTARFFVWAGEEIVGAGQGTGLPTGTSDPAVLESTLNIELAANMIPPDATGWSVEIVEADKSNGKGKRGTATFPEEESAALDVGDAGPTIKVYIIPVRTQGDVPSVGDNEAEQVRRLMRSLYPTPDVEVQVGDPWDYPRRINGQGDQGPLLEAMGNYKETIGVPGDWYIYGVHTGYGGGLAWLGALMGVGGNLQGTMAHELGHAQGLFHAPCGGAGGPDPDYPYPGASIGTFGWDLENGTLHDPANKVDLMSYCDPTWISDYHYTKAWEQRVRIQELYDPQDKAVARRWQTIWMPEGHPPALGPTREYRYMPVAEPTVVEIFGEDGESELVEGLWTPFSHGSGGALLVPEDVDVADVAFDGERFRPLPMGRGVDAD